MKYKGRLRAPLQGVHAEHRRLCNQSGSFHRRRLQKDLQETFENLITEVRSI